MSIHFTKLPVIKPTSAMSAKVLERKTVPELKKMAQDVPGYVDSLSKIGLIHLLTGSPNLIIRDIRHNKATKKDLRYLFDHYNLKVDHSQMTVGDYYEFLRELQSERVKKSLLEDAEKAKIELQELGIKVPKTSGAILGKLRQEKEKRKLQAEKAFRESLNDENLNKLSTEELKEIAQQIKRIGYKTSFRKYQLIPFILGQRVPTRKPSKTTKKQKVDISYMGSDFLTTLPDELLVHILRNLDTEHLRSVCISNKRLQILCQERWIQHKIQELRVFPGSIMSIIKNDQLYIFGRNKYVVPYLDLVLPSGDRPTIKYGSVYGKSDEENNVIYNIPKVILPDYMGLPSGAFALRNDCYFVYNTEGELFAIGNGKLGCLGTGTKGNRRKWTKIKGIRGKVIALRGNVRMYRHPTKMETIHYGEMYGLTEAGDVYFWGGDRYLIPQLISSDMKFIDLDRNLLISENYDVYIMSQKTLSVNPHKLNKEQVAVISGNMYLNREGRVIRHIFLPRDRIRTPIQEKFVPTDNLEVADPSIDLLYKDQGKYVYVALEKLPFDERVIDLVGGMDFNVLLTEHGEVYTLGGGRGKGYRIGHYRGRGPTRIPLPTLVELPDIVQTITANRTDVAIVTENKRIFFWGQGYDYPKEIRL